MARPSLAQFHAWWNDSYPGAPVNAQTAGICVAFASHCIASVEPRPLTDEQLIAAATSAGLCYPECWDFEDHPERLQHLRSYADLVLHDSRDPSTTQ